MWSSSKNPTLWRVRLYFCSGLPSPIISFMFLVSQKAAKPQEINQGIATKLDIDPPPHARGGGYLASFAPAEWPCRQVPLTRRPAGRLRLPCSLGRAGKRSLNAEVEGDKGAILG